MKENKLFCRVCAVFCAFLLLISSMPYAFADTEGEADSEEESSPTVFHVKEGGTGDGKTKEEPSCDIALGFEAMREGGGEIIVYGRYDLSKSTANDSIWGAFVEPSHSAKITVSGADGYLVCPENYRYYMSGETEFKNIGFSGSGAFLIAARFNALTMGEGINIIGFSSGVYLIGGFNGSNSGLNEEDLKKDSSITVRSGVYKYICAYNRATASKNCTGEARISIYGGEINCIAAGLSNSNEAFTSNKMKKLTVDILGGRIYKICDTDMAVFGKLSSFELCFTGGEIENILLSDKSTSSISFTDDTEKAAAKFLKYFSSYKKGEGEFVETEKIKIACVGDNITLGVGLSDAENESYPAHLQKMLGDSYEVKNFSEGGKTLLYGSALSYSASSVYNESLLYLPDVVFIMLGANDLSQIKDAQGVHPTLYKDALALIKSYSDLPSTPVVYILSPTQRTDDSVLERALSGVLCPTLKKAATDAQVGYIDIYSVSKNMKDHFTDSVHPDAIACSYIATWLHSAVISNGEISQLPTSDVKPVEIIINENPTDTDGSAAENEKGKNKGVGSIGYVISFILVSASVLTLGIVYAKGKIKKAESEQIPELESIETSEDTIKETSEETSEEKDEENIR